MNQHLTWHFARSFGMAAWAVLAGSMLLGLATAVPRVRRRVDPVTTQALHRYLGGFGIVLVAGHIAALVFDRYVPFGWKEVLLPLASRWRTGPIAWGVVGLYLLVIVEGSSLMKRHLPYGRWWRVHLMSYFAFAAVSLHALSAGTDSRRWVPLALSVALGALTVVGCFWRQAHEQNGVRARLGLQDDSLRSPSGRAPRRK